MFKGPVPPIVPFALGSLGFMTPFRILILSGDIPFSSILNFESCICAVHAKS